MCVCECFVLSGGKKMGCSFFLTKEDMTCIPLSLKEHMSQSVNTQRLCMLPIDVSVPRGVCAAPHFGNDPKTNALGRPD